MINDQIVQQSYILDNIPDVIIATDLSLNIISWNKAAEKNFGYCARQVTGKSIRSITELQLHSATIPEVSFVLREKGSWQGDVTFSGKKGVFYYSFTLSYLRDAAGSRNGYIAIGKDITDKKLSELKLKQNERFYRGLISDALDGILLLNREGNITFMTPAIKQILGYEASEIIGTNAFHYVHPEDRKWSIHSFYREVEENPEIKFIVIRLKRKSGEWLWCMVRGHNLLHNPAVNSIAVYVHDDTLRKKTTEALKESEQRFRTLIRDLQVGVLLQDESGRITMSNKAMHEILDISERELAGQKFWELFPDVIDENEQPFPVEERPSYKAWVTKEIVSDIVIGLRTHTKKRVWLLVNGSPILNTHGELEKVVLSFKDITERRKLEKQLLVDQLNLQRYLTQASIASQENERREIGKELHDNYGQQLTTVKLYLDLAKSTADGTTAEMIALSLRSISDVINGIRALSRSLIPSTLGDLGLVESVKDLLEGISRTTNISIYLQHDDFYEDKISENFKLVLFRMIQEQLNNIIKHAEAKTVRITLQNPSSFQLLEITDDGKGFDLLRTKKGLGLVNIRSRAEMYNGNVEIRTSPGRGCSVMITIPLQQEPSIV